MKVMSVGAALALLPAMQCVHAQVPSAKDFSKHPEINEVQLSPTGEYVAMAVPSADGTETMLQIVPLVADGKTQALRFPGKQHVSDIVWTADDEIVVSRAVNRPFRPQPVSYGELMSTNLTGKDQETLFAYIRDESVQTARRKDEGFASIVGTIDSEPGMALVSYSCYVCGEDPDTVVFKVNTRTGARQEIERQKGQASFVFDTKGRARIKQVVDINDNPTLFFRPEPQSEWQPMPKSIAGRTILSGRFADNDKTLYAVLSDGGEPGQLYRIDLPGGSREKLAGRVDEEIGSLLYAGHNGIPFGVVYTSGKPSVQYIDPKSDWAKLHAGLLKAFPGQMVSFTAFSRDDKKASFYTWSDRNIGAYYVIDRANNGVQLIGEAYPWLKSASMVSMRPIEFTARDGVKLFGQLTMSGTGPRPMVVMPHGGPFGVTDRWGFDRDAQFLATRGYAVLQVNYRGSGGRGENFVKSGWREWGGKLVDDVADGVDWAIQQKIADPARVCTYGASYGGYSAMMTPIRYPGKFKCAAGYAGVYSLPLLHKTDSMSRTDRGRNFRDRTVGTDPKLLADQSPALRASELKIPVLLIHGKDDPTAKPDQLAAMKAALTSAGNAPETYVVAGEGHGFYSEKAQTEAYMKLESFLDKSIGAGAK